MSKQVLYSNEAREKILSGAKKITDAIKVTLGPQGRNVIISESVIVDYGVQPLPLHVTKDGYTVARHFDISGDAFERAGVLAIKECTQKTVDEAGDGTTTTAILCYQILEAGIKAINEGVNPIQIKKEIDAAVEKAVNEIKNTATPIAGDVEKIRQIATISANNDSSIGDLIASAFEKIGDYGVINIEEAKGVETEIKIAEGLKIDRGWVSPFFVNNREKQTCEFDNPLILLYQNRITHHSQYQRAVEYAIKSARPLLIICEDADEEGLATLVMNNQRGALRCCIVRSPFIGTKRLLAMEDIAVATGGKFISDSKGVGIKEIDESYFGSARKVIISKSETVIIEGSKNKENYDDLIAELKMNLTQAKDENDKAEIETRIATLTGGIAVIYVGAATEVEMKEKKDRVDDAIRATKSAIAEGYVAGGGTLFAKIKTGSDILDTALENPLLQICENAGEDAKKILKEVKNSESEEGYNAKSDVIENLIKAGVIDPAKVLRCSIQNAASSATMMLISECLIVDNI